MKIFILFFFVIFLTFLSAFEKKSIFILHSYSQEYGWTKLQHDNFVEKLQASSHYPLDISVEYLDTKRLQFSPDYEIFFRSYLEKKFHNLVPDAIYVTDDNALKFFLHQPHLFQTSPIFFSGVNNLALASKLDKNRYCGVYEVKEIVPNIDLIRQFSPQTRDIWIIGDDSSTYHSIESDIRAHINRYPKYTFHFISSTRIDNIMAKLPNTPKTFIILTTIGGLCDANKNNLTLQESITRFKQNKNFILCSMEDAYVQGGVVGGYVTSGAYQGRNAAQQLLRYLSGEPVKQIQSIIKSPNVYMFDRNALMQSRLILSEYIAHDAIILHEEKSFFERYQESILNGIFILVILFLMFILIVFLISMQKNGQLKRLEKSLQECSDNLKNQKDKSTILETSDE